MVESVRFIFFLLTRTPSYSPREDRPAPAIHHKIATTSSKTTNTTNAKMGSKNMTVFLLYICPRWLSGLNNAVSSRRIDQKSFRRASFRVNLFWPVNKSVSAPSRVAPVKEVFGAVTLGDDSLKFFAFGLLCATLRTGHVRVDNGVVIQHIHHPLRHKAPVQLSPA